MVGVSRATSAELKEEEANEEKKKEIKYRKGTDEEEELV